MNHEQLLETAKTAADRLFADTSVPMIETREVLINLQSHIDLLFDATRHQLPGETK